MTQTTESELASIMLAIGRLEGKVDSLLARQDELASAIQRVRRYRQQSRSLYIGGTG